MPMGNEFLDAMYAAHMAGYTLSLVQLALLEGEGYLLVATSENGGAEE